MMDKGLIGPKHKFAVLWNGNTRGFKTRPAAEQYAAIRATVEGLPLTAFAVVPAKD